MVEAVGAAVITDAPKVMEATEGVTVIPVALVEAGLTGVVIG